MVEVLFSAKEYGDHPAIGIFVSDKLKIDSNIMLLDQQYHGLISKTIQNNALFKGKFGQTLNLTTTDKHGNVKFLILVGIGNEDSLIEADIEEIGGKIHAAATMLKLDSVITKVDSGIGKFDAENTAALIGSGALLAAYRHFKYRTKLSTEEKKVCGEFNIICQNENKVEELFLDKKAVALSVAWTRDLVSEVPNILYPESYAEEVVKKLEPLGIEVEVFGEREMRDMGMGALLGVGQGSSKESKMVVMRYQGTDENKDPVCFVGKGVTFDTGGISIKPALGMHDMKYDMAGSAAVVGAMKALALRNAKVNAVGVIGLVENMPGGNAQRPGDVVTTMSGQTVEVLNTDAEGRLVLCDCLAYLQKHYNPACVIDLATLTGAIVIALANTYAGCFANDDELANQLIASGHKMRENLWRMPLHKDYDEMINSTVADIANIGSEKGAAGSATAAQFLARFINNGVKWAHLDIAGMAWERRGKYAITPKGASGFGVRLLNQFVMDNYESK